jgi:hypothetical protein
MFIDFTVEGGVLSSNTWRAKVAIDPPTGKSNLPKP